jgi:RNA polymerase sigma factor (sigma-70 family)
MPDSNNLNKSAKIEDWRSLMTNIAEFCPHPDDPESCKKELIKRLQDGSLEKHCIFEGLRANWHQCRQVLLEGFYSPKAKSEEDSTAGIKMTHVSKSDLDEACKNIALLGFPEGIAAIWEVFYEAYYGLVRSTIRRMGIRDNEEPFADDVFQQAFENLLEHFQKKRAVKGRFSTYVTSVTVNACYNAINKAWKRKTLTYEDKLKEKKDAVAVFVPPEVLEHWEELDNELSKSNQGDVKNRIILALQCLEACSSGRRPSAQWIRDCWQALSKYSDDKKALLYKKTKDQLERFGSMGAVNIVADLANNRHVESPSDVPIVFAAATGKNSQQVNELLDELRSLTEGAIYTRITRIYMVLQPPKKGDQ